MITSLQQNKFLFQELIKTEDTLVTHADAVVELDSITSELGIVFRSNCTPDYNFLCAKGFAKFR
jgi:hypothetical protein